MLCIENNYTRWKKQYDIKYDQVNYKKFNNMEQSVKTAKKYANLKQDTITVEKWKDKNGLERERVALAGPSFRSPFTCDKGQHQFHGWNDLGTNRYNELRKANKTLREGPKKADTLAFEKAFLTKLKASLRITENDKESQKRANKRAKKTSGMTPDELAAANAVAEMED